MVDPIKEMREVNSFMLDDIQYVLSQKSHCYKRNGKRAAYNYRVVEALGRFGKLSRN